VAPFHSQQPVGLTVHQIRNRSWSDLPEPVPRPDSRSSSRSPAGTGCTCRNPRAVDRDGVALLDRGDTVADRVDPSGVLVAQRQRHLPRHHAGLEVAHHVQVGVTRPGAADPDDYLAGPLVGFGTSTSSGSVFQSTNRSAFIAHLLVCLGFRPRVGRATLRCAESGWCPHRFG